MTVQILIEQALSACGQLGFGRGAGASESATAMIVLNRLIDSWNAQRQFVMGLDVVAITTVSGTRSYPMATRPAHIERAEFMVSAGGITIPVPVKVVGVDEFTAFPAQSDVSPFPKLLWCDYGATTATVFLAPMPTVGSLRVYTWIVLPQYSALSDTVTLLPGVQRALIDNLALMLAPALGKAATPELAGIAAQSLGAMEKLNIPKAAA